MAASSISPRMAIPRLPDGPDGEHLPDRLATETVRFIDANRERPFFAFLSFYDVHTPLMARPDLQRKYEEKRQRLGLEAALGPRARAGRAPRAGARRLRRHGGRDGSGGRQGPRSARRARPAREHAGRLHERQRRSVNERGLAHVERAAAGGQGLDVRRRPPRAAARAVAEGDPRGKPGGQPRQQPRLLPDAARGRRCAPAPVSPSTA